MLISEVRLQNFLSFGPAGVKLPLGPLNVLIGPNGSGKSNFIDAFWVPRTAPAGITALIAEGEAATDWLWNGNPTPAVAKLGFTVDGVTIGPADRPSQLDYTLSFTADESHGLKIVAESVGRAADGSHPDGLVCRRLADGDIWAEARENGFGGALSHRLPGGHIAPDVSILSQPYDPSIFPEMAELAKDFGEISIYRYLDPGCGLNAADLGSALLRLDGEPGLKERLTSEMSRLYPAFTGFKVRRRGGAAQVAFLEGRYEIPATRLSGGTLRYLGLLCVLLDPTPPPLVCLEGPEAGLHPNLLPGLGRLLIEASERTQLIVTTHSETLVDAFHTCPESVVVCEMDGEAGTRMERLDPEELKPWLGKYRLADIWGKGLIGGVRW